MAEFLNPIQKYGFKYLEITYGKKISKINLITKPRKLNDLIQGELELRTELYLAFGSELITYGIERALTILSELQGREISPELAPRIKYSITRIEPEFTEEEEARAQELYQEKLNKPVSQFIDAIGKQMKRGKELLEHTEQFAIKEGRKVAQEEIIRRLRKTGKELGFDLGKISKRTERLLDTIINIIGEKEMEVVPEYRALIKPKTKKDVNPQLVIHQTGHDLRILGGSQLTSEQEFDDVDPELLSDTLKYILLTKAKK